MRFHVAVGDTTATASAIAYEPDATIGAQSLTPDSWRVVRADDAETAYLTGLRDSTVECRSSVGHGGPREVLRFGREAMPDSVGEQA